MTETPHRATPPEPAHTGEKAADEALAHCSVCGKNALEKVVTSVVFYWEETPVIVDNVPALICRNCGEQHLENRVADQLDRIRRTASNMTPVRHVSVPVIDYADADREEPA